MSGYTTAAVVGAALVGSVASASYTARKSGHAMREAQANAPRALPAPPAATPATLAQSMTGTTSNRIPGAGGGIRGGTIGDKGPQGLTAAPQTAGLTLLGGTK